MRSVLALTIAAMTACGSHAAPAVDASPDAVAIPDGPPPVACTAGPKTGDACAKMADLCATANGCCVCGGLEGICAALWVCATPSSNDPACPATMPAEATECTTSSATFCDYCGAAGEPVRVECLDQATYQPCRTAGFARCWHPSDQSAGCD